MHSYSRVKDMPFMKLDCGAIPKVPFRIVSIVCSKYLSDSVNVSLCVFYKFAL
ncbi:hypothetical protein ACFPFV_07490 [Salinicoccus siamensis]|uniref:hypothetical protein n=1 Tax=Salinicoccus siamensis TaxID=381830 RepID=UPI00361588ED